MLDMNIFQNLIKGLNEDVRVSCEKRLMQEEKMYQTPLEKEIIRLKKLFEKSWFQKGLRENKPLALACLKLFTKEAIKQVVEEYNDFDVTDAFHIVSNCSAA